MKSHIVISEVINNNPEQQDGRIQIRTPIYDDGIDDDKLPWAFPLTASFFNIPEVGTKVYINIADPHEPIYLGNVIDAESIDPAFKEDYPNLIGFVSSAGVRYTINNKTGESKLSIPNGIRIEFDVLGNMDIKTQRGNINLEGANITIKANKNLNLEGKDVEIKGKKVKFKNEGEQHNYLNGSISFVSQPHLVPHFILETCPLKTPYSSAIFCWRSPNQALL